MFTLGRYTITDRPIPKNPCMIEPHIDYFGPPPTIFVCKLCGQEAKQEGFSGPIRCTNVNCFNHNHD